MAQKPNTKPKRGRPADLAHPHRYPLKHDDEQKAHWIAAAATCGLTLQDWMRQTLDGESRRAHHVPMIKREGARRVAG